MTRTARSGFPKAMLKDRSESRSGLDKSMRKNGGGGHNWGRLADERAHEYAALDDELLEMSTETADESDTASMASESTTDSITGKPATQRTTSEQDVRAAQEFRKHVFKGQVDLAAIARTSAAVSGSPPN